MTAIRRLTAVPLVLLVATFGCVHRSPVWSPDGRFVLVLGAASAEESVDQPASRLWIVDVEKKAPRSLDAPAAGHRFLAALWLDNSSILVATGRWKDDEIVEGSEAWWRRGIASTAWKKLAIPPPSGSRVTRRQPVLLDPTPDGPTLAYATGYEDTIVVALESGSTLHTLPLTETIGPGSPGSLLVQRETDRGTTELALVETTGENRWKDRWTVGFTALRASIAEATGTKPVAVVINDASTSHRPFPHTARSAPPKAGPDSDGTRSDEPASDTPGADASPDWIGVTVHFSDVGWKNGIPGYYLRIAAADAALLSATKATGLAGRPAGDGRHAWCVTAPDKSAGTPPTLRSFHLETHEPTTSRPLADVPKEGVHGYSLDPRGGRLALSLSVPRRELLVYEADRNPLRISLE